MSLGGWLWGTSQVDEAIEKATSELLPAGQEDIALNLEICDQIRSKSVQPKDAMRALKRRLNHKNPNVQLLALSLTDICIKNGGDHFLVEVTSREFMDNLASILKIPGLNFEVKNKILRLIGNWSASFEGKPSLSYVGVVHKTLKTEGFNFPAPDIAAANSAMVDTQTAPEWIDSDVCLRCRTPFSFTNRKHHCRNCGQVFDHQCSSKAMPLPHFGIAQDVRVCDACQIKLTKGKKDTNRDHKSHRHSSPRYSSNHDLVDSDLQRAIRASLAETGARNGGSYRPGYVPSQPSPSAYNYQSSEPPLVDRTTRPGSANNEDEDPDLKAAIEASLREANAPRPSAPMPMETPREEQNVAFAGPYDNGSYTTTSQPTQATIPALPNYDLQPLEADAILSFNQVVEQVEQTGGRDMSRYPAVHELYDKANGLKPKLAISLDDTDRKERLLAEMHDKLSQAVKLYDKLLTEQLSRPSWRSPAGPSSQASQYSSYAAPHNSFTPHQQHVVSPISEIPSQQPPQSVYNTVPSPTPNGWANTHQRTQSLNVLPNAGVPQPQWQSPTPQQQYIGPPPMEQHVAPAQAPAPQPPMPISAQQSPPAQDYSYTQPAQVSPPATNPQNTAYQQAFQPTYQPAYQPVSATPVPIPPPSAPIPQQNSTPYAQPQPQMPIMTSPPPSFVPLQTPSIAPPPQFPNVPSANPQGYPMYGPGVPTGVEQTERKEVLLIDL